MQAKKAVSQITEGVIWKQILLFFFPILMGSFFQQMYNMVDTIIVGRAVGTQALAAVGSSGSLINLINGFFIGLSAGATVILSQHYGAADRDGVEKAMHTGFALSLCLGCIIMIIGIFLGPTVLRLIDTPENCMDQAVTYVQIYFSGAIASMVYNMGTRLCDQYCTGYPVCSGVEHGRGRCRPGNGAVPVHQRGTGYRYTLPPALRVPPPF